MIDFESPRLKPKIKQVEKDNERDNLIVILIAFNLLTYSTIRCALNKYGFYYLHIVL